MYVHCIASYFVFFPCCLFNENIILYFFASNLKSLLSRNSSLLHHVFILLHQVLHHVFFFLSFLHHMSHHVLIMLGNVFVMLHHVSSMLHQTLHHVFIMLHHYTFCVSDLFSATFDTQSCLNQTQVFRYIL